MEGRSGVEGQTGPIERQAEDVRPFYAYILGRELDDKEIAQSYYLIEADVLQVNMRIDEFIKDNPGTTAKVLLVMAGNNIPDDLLVGCDPNNQLFIVSGYSGNTQV